MQGPRAVLSPAPARRAGVFTLDPTDSRLPATAIVALLDILDVTPDHARLLAGLDLAALDDVAHLVVLRTWHRVAAWVAAQEQLALVAVAGPQAPAGDDWVAEEVAAALHLAPSTAARRIRAARSLTGRLSDTWAALAAGRIPYWHAAHLADALTEHTDELAATVQAAVLPRAGGQTYGQFRRAVAQAIAAADPATLEQRHAKAARSSDVQVWAEDDGMAALLARGPATQIYELYDRLSWQAAAATRSATPGEDAPSIGERRFAALAGSDSASGPPGGRRLAGVLLDLATAVGVANNPGEIPGYGPIPASLAREYAAGADWQAWLTDAATGCLIGLGTASYQPTRRLREFVEARDRTCRHPGCARPAWRCDVDHAIPYDQGGCTDPANCGCFCRRHHRLKHEAGWTTRRDPDGTVHFTTPLHQQHTVDPPDYLWMLDPPPASTGLNPPGASDPPAVSEPPAVSVSPEADDPPSSHPRAQPVTDRAEATDDPPPF